MPTIQNDLLSIDIKTVGAELCKISAVNNNNQFYGTQTLMFGEATLLTYFLLLEV